MHAGLDVAVKHLSTFRLTKIHVRSLLSMVEASPRFWNLLTQDARMKVMILQAMERGYIDELCVYGNNLGVPSIISQERCAREWMELKKWTEDNIKSFFARHSFIECGTMVWCDFCKKQVPRIESGEMAINFYFTDEEQLSAVWRFVPRWIWQHNRSIYSHDVVYQICRKCALEENLMEERKTQLLKTCNDDMKTRKFLLVSESKSHEPFLYSDDSDEDPTEQQDSFLLRGLDMLQQNGITLVSENNPE